MKRRLTLGAVLVALVAAGFATYALAAASDGGTINACVAADGKLGIANGDCKKNETPLSWNATGAQGPQGPAGAQGPAGPQGPAGAAAANPDAIAGTIEVTGSHQGAFSTTPMALTAITHAISAPFDNSGGGAGVGKVDNKPLTVTMRFDKSTPHFLLALVTGETLTPVVISLLKSDGSLAATITMQHAEITDYAQHGPNVQFSFVYGSIAWSADGVTTSEENGKG